MSIEKLKLRCEVSDYFVYHEAHLGDRPKKFSGTCHRDIAYEYAREYNDNGDHRLLDEIITIKVEKDGYSKYYRLSAEPDIHYNEDEIDEDEYMEDIFEYLG